MKLGGLVQSGARKLFSIGIVRLVKVVNLGRN